MSIQENIFEAMSIIADKKISEVKFDKTIECLVVSEAKADKGIYRVRYQDTEFDAYSNTNTVKYRKNTNVYVLVPQGDFSNRKSIIGKKEDRGEGFIDVTDAIDRIEVLEDNNYVEENPSEHFNVCLRGERLVKIKKFKYDNFIKDYQNKQFLLIGANIVSNITNKLINFGIYLDVVYEDQSEKRYKMDLSDMTGNPYKLEGGYQYKIFPLTLLKIKEVKGLYLFVEEVGETLSEPLENCITFKGVEVYFAKPKEIESLDTFTGELKAERGTVFKNGIKNPEEKLTLEMVVKKSGRKFTPNAVYKWFYSDLNVKNDLSPGWDQDGGEGWYYINPPKKPKDKQLDYLTFDEKTGEKVLYVQANGVPNFEIFKCVAIFGGEKIKDEEGHEQTVGITKIEAIEQIIDQTDGVTVEITSSRGDIFNGDEIESTILTCNVYVGLGGAEDPKKFKYSWGIVGEDGRVKPIEGHTLVESNTYTVENIKALENTSSYICEVFLK